VSFVDVDGGQLAYERAGSGPPLVLLPGMGLDEELWADVAALLAPRFDTIRLQPRGHGKSSRPDGPFVHADDVARALDGLGVDAAHFAGHSQGGAIALDVALAHPARVRSLALVDSGLDGHDWSPAWRDAFRAETWLAPLFATRPELAPRVDAMLARWSRPAGRSRARPLSPRAATRLSEIRVPTLVVVGERDLPDFHVIASRLAREIAGARLVTLEGVGHLAPLEAPERVAELIAGA
jgi:pimeloyl-ACP methyl ester carboxylesterase